MLDSNIMLEVTALVVVTVPKKSNCTNCLKRDQINLGALLGEQVTNEDMPHKHVNDRQIIGSLRPVNQEGHIRAIDSHVNNEREGIIM